MKNYSFLSRISRYSRKRLAPHEKSSYNSFFDTFFSLIPLIQYVSKCSFLSGEETEICNYADDTTIYVCGQELERIVSSLENDAQRISQWFFDNSMKLNPDKCHLLIFAGRNADLSVRIGETMVTESVEEKLLGVTLDKNLNFKGHFNAICKKAGQKLHALARVANYMKIT